MARGTSFASPMVAGVAAHVWSANASLTGEQVKQAVVGGASCKVGYSDEARDAIAAFDPNMTYFLLNAEGAMQMALTPTTSGGFSGTFSYVAQAGGHRGSLTVNDDGTATVVEVSSGTGQIYTSVFQVSQEDIVDGTTLGQGVVVYRLIPTGEAGQVTMLGDESGSVIETFGVNADRVFGYDPATDTVVENDAYLGEWTIDASGFVRWTH